MKKQFGALCPSFQIRRMVRFGIFETYLIASCLKSVIISEYAIVITVIFPPANSPEKYMMIISSLRRT